MLQQTQHDLIFEVDNIREHIFDCFGGHHHSWVPTPYAQHSRLPQGQCREPRPDVHTRLCFEADVCVLLGFVSLLARVNNFEYLRGPCCNDVGTWSELICHILSDLDVKLSKNMFCMLLPRVMRSGNLRQLLS